MSSSNNAGTSAPPSTERDLYEVLGIRKDASEKEVKIAYRRLALMYHPDKIVGDPKAPERFIEIAYANSILSDPHKRREYDKSGSMALTRRDTVLEIDMSNLGTISTIFAAFFSMLGVPIKTKVPTSLLENTLDDRVNYMERLTVNSHILRQVKRLHMDLFTLEIDAQEARDGIIIKVTSPFKDRFKLLYFVTEENGGYGLTWQEDCENMEGTTVAGMYFLHFQVYHINSTLDLIERAKDPKPAIIKRLEDLQPCEISELKAGTHIFAVYGDNFFNPASYTIEVMCSTMLKDKVVHFRRTEEEILRKKNDLWDFELEKKRQSQEGTAIYDEVILQQVADVLEQRVACIATLTLQPRRPISPWAKLWGSFKTKIWSFRKTRPTTFRVVLIFSIILLLYSSQD